MKVSLGECVLAIGNVINVPFTFFFFREHFDFSLGYEGKLGGGCFCFFLAIGNVINVSFALDYVNFTF